MLFQIRVAQCREAVLTHQEETVEVVNVGFLFTMTDKRPSVMVMCGGEL